MEEWWLDRVCSENKQHHDNTFTENSRYEYYLETKIMKKFKLQYIEDACIKWSIARMIVTRKCELAKVINKRAERTHQKKILKTRLKKDETEEDNALKMKMYSYRIKDEWYNDDGSVYDHKKK